MNVTKKVIAVIVIAVIIIRAFTIETFALAGAPVIAAEELATLLETALVGMGLNADDLDGKDYNDLMDEFKIQMSTNPNFNPKKIVQYPKPEYVGPGFLTACLMDLLTKPEVQAGIGVSNAILSSIADDVISDFFSDYTKLSDSVVPTPTVDLKGSGALGVYKGENSLYNHIRYVYGNYGIVNFMPNGKNAWERNCMCSNDSPSCYVIDYIYKKDGSLFRIDKFFVDDYREYVNFSQLAFSVDTVTSVNYYGDWRTVDDTPIETDDTEVPVIGEADGTQVTPDMLNPDGTVTIDGTTYYPKDFIDWDKFKDPAIIDLLNQILDAIDNAPVVSEQDKPIVDVDSIEIAVPDELSDYTVPVGISSVFPFCLPFDFSRGIKMLLAEPEVPVFKTEIDMTDFCGFDLGVIPLEISLEKWEPAVVVIRWFILLLFIFSLIFISTKIVKGAGA